MKQADVNTGDILWTNASGRKVQVNVLRTVDRVSFGGRKQTKFLVQNLTTERTLTRSAAALHRTRDFEADAKARPMDPDSVAARVEPVDEDS